MVNNVGFDYCTPFFYSRLQAIKTFFKKLFTGYSTTTRAGRLQPGPKNFHIKNIRPNLPVTNRPAR